MKMKRSTSIVILALLLSSIFGAAVISAGDMVISSFGDKKSIKVDGGETPSSKTIGVIPSKLVFNGKGFIIDEDYWEAKALTIYLTSNSVQD